MRKTVTILVVLAGLACLWQAGRAHAPLLELRRTYHLNQADPLENTPPLVAFTTVALGGFRGLLADLLWMRASELQDEGKYFELVQLADWITKLQPRFASIWAFHAWNLAYNISVMLPDPADRWRWVNHGIRLLRDEGLVYNPGNAHLYRELSWLFFHKMGDDIDQAHLYYKKTWADLMTVALGGARPDFAALAAAPAAPADLLADPAAAALADKVRRLQADPFGPDILQPEENLGPELSKLLRDDPAAPALKNCARARLLREVYRLDPRRMKAVDDQYGPFDWRLPYAHAVYWAAEGLTYASGFDAVALRRSVFQAMASAFLRGRLVTGSDGLFMITPNLPQLDRVKKAYEDAIEEFPDQATYRDAYQIFLTDAVMIAFSYNRQREARTLYEDLKARYPGEDKKDSVEAFVFDTYRTFIGDATPAQTLAVVESALVQSYFWQLAGDEDQAAGYERIARLCWDNYMAQRKNPEMRERTGLPPLDEMRAEARERARAMLRKPEGG